MIPHAPLSSPHFRDLNAARSLRHQQQVPAVSGGRWWEHPDTGEYSVKCHLKQSICLKCKIICLKILKSMKDTDFMAKTMKTQAISRCFFGNLILFGPYVPIILVLRDNKWFWMLCKNISPWWEHVATGAGTRAEGGGETTWDRELGRRDSRDQGAGAGRHSHQSVDRVT